MATISVRVDDDVKRDFEGLNITKLKNGKHIWRCILGKYRLIYHDDGVVIIPIKFGSRGDIYK